MNAVELTMLAGTLLCFPAMACLSFAMERHYGQLTGKREVPVWHRNTLRGLGWCLLGLSCAAFVAALGAAIGGAAWFGFLGIAGIIVAWVLPYHARAVAYTALMLLIVSVSVSVFVFVFVSVCALAGAAGLPCLRFF